MLVGYRFFGNHGSVSLDKSVGHHQRRAESVIKPLDVWNRVLVVEGGLLKRFPWTHWCHRQ
jgi:hypothetical protein